MPQKINANKSKKKIKNKILERSLINKINIEPREIKQAKIYLKRVEKGIISYKMQN